MKTFKKRHSRIPDFATTLRLVRKFGPSYGRRYSRQYRACPSIIPDLMRISCLASFDPNKRQNIQYYPDLHNFILNDAPNRSLPIPKFLAMFRGFIPNAELDELEKNLTNFRLEFYTDPEDWIKVYADDTIVGSCMSASIMVKCYAHKENNLALATLYAPGGTQVIARTIVNLVDKWYVRLFGDLLLVEKLMEAGFKRLEGTCKEFKMYAYAGAVYDDEALHYPYFDFYVAGIRLHKSTYNSETQLVEVTINPGVL